MMMIYGVRAGWRRRRREGVKEGLNDIDKNTLTC